MHRGEIVRHVIIYAFVIVGLFLTLAPFFWILSTALRPNPDVYIYPIAYLPPHVTLQNFIDLLLNRTTVPLHLEQGFSRSVTVTLSATVVSLLLASLAGYAMARFRFRGRDAFGLAMLGTQMMPPILFLVPLFLILKGLRLTNTLAGLTLTYLSFTLPFCTWMLRGYFTSIPEELEDAAAIDGCNRLQTLCYIVLPLAAPALVATGTFALIYAWNEFLFAFVIAGKTPLMSVQLYSIIGQYYTPYPVLMSAAILISLPPIVLFLLMSRYLIAGLTAGAVKY
jgi:ABC-type glycerol-3-phosphate transport system permease component